MNKLLKGLASLVATSGAVLLLSAPVLFGFNRSVMEGIEATNNAIFVSTGSSAATSQVTVQNLVVQQLSPNQCVQTSTGGLISTSGSQCGSGGGGVVGSTGTPLAVTVGGIIISSPTYQLNFPSTNFTGSLTGGATANVDLNTTVGQGQTFIMASPASQQPNTVWVGTVTTLSANIGSVSSTAGPRGNSDFAGAWAVISTSGTTQGLTVIVNGLPSNGVQNKIGGVTIRDDYVGDSGMHPALLVLVDSSTDAQSGRGLVEIWSLSNNANDPKFWFHVNGHDSSPEIRDDAGAPNWEMICTSTDNAHGKGKFEPAAIPYQGVHLQVNSRAYDNSAFENIAYWTALQDPAPGLYLQSQTLVNDSGILTSSDTFPIHWTTQNNHTVGLEGPLNTTASWRFRLPATFSNAGQVLYQAGNDATSARPWAFTTGGSAGNVLSNNGTNAPTWITAILSTESLQSGTTFYVSSGTVAGDFAFGSTAHGFLTYNSIGTLLIGNGVSVTGGSFSVNATNGVTFQDNATTESVTIRSSATTANYSLTWPNAQGSTNTVLMNGGSGNLSFSVVPLLSTSQTWTGVNTFTSSTTMAGISSTAHLNVRSSVPSLSSCGSSPSITGTDNAGTITEGTGSPTGCVVTFNATWGSSPFCVVQTTSTVTTAAITAVSTSQFTITTSASIPSDTLNYVCLGRD